MTTRYERQWTECEAIKSIYEKEFEEIKFPWKVDHPPCFNINLPAGISIEIRMTKNYPEELPELRVHRRREDLAANQAKDIEKKIQATARQFIGSEMIYEIIEEAKSLIQRLLQPTSFHAEMLQRQEEQATKQSDLQAINAQKRLDLEARKKLEEMAAMERLIALELSHEKQQEVDEERNAHVPSLQTFSFKPAFVVDGQELDKFVSVSQLSPNSFKVQTPQGDGPFLLKTHQLPPFQGHRKIEMMVKVLKAHEQLKPHENVRRILGAQLSTDRLELSILKEYVEGSKLSDVVEQAGRIAPEQAFEYVKGIASGLAHLHESGLSHRALSLASVIVCKGIRAVKVSGYLTKRALAANDSDVIQAPECRSRPNFESKAGDVWCLGRMLLEMLFGSVVDRGDSFDTLIALIPSEPLRHLCSRLLAEDPKQRLSAQQVAQYEIHFAPDQLILLPRVSPCHRPATPTPPTAPTTAAAPSSRYQADFEELEFLGRGGFGSVVKARNKIDNLVYAIKKVPLDPQNVDYNKKILREVTTLSRMHHERVIRYYQAWIESEGDHKLVTEVADDSTFTKGAEDFTFTKDDSLAFFSSSSSEDDFSSDDIVFQDNQSSSDAVQFEGNSEFSFESGSGSRLHSRSKFFSSAVVHSTDTLSSGGFESTTKTPASSNAKQFLYIQMEYCPNQTLRDLLDERATEGANATHVLDPPELWRLFRQIVEGLAHIHAQGMMHRDLKPSNIFLDSNGDIKIGDFGLAVTKAENLLDTTSIPEAQLHQQQQQQLSQRAFRNASVKFESSLTTNIGTPFYVSPEQYQSGASRYNQKVDMYALGIILVELWCPFATGMERAHALRDCRLEIPRLPANLPPAVKQIALKLLDHDPKKRFSSFELLKCDLLPPMLEADLLDDAVRTVAQPGTPQHPRLISTIFARQAELGQSVKRPKDFAFDVRSGNVGDVNVLDRMTRLQLQLERLFTAHGAILVNPPLLLIPLSEPSSRAYCVLDETGQLLQLPNELTRPFARFVAQSNIHALKRFSFDRVFSKANAHIAGGQPHQTLQASFDIVSPKREKHAVIPVLEAFECVKMAVEVCSLIFKAESLVMKLGHAQLRQSLLAGKADVVVAAAAVVADEANLSTGQAVTNAFNRSTYPEAAVLKATQSANESNEAFLRRLNAPESLLQFLSVLSKSGLKVRIVVDPLMHSGVYTGMVFSLLHERRRGSSYELLANGGDYSDLVEEYRFPTARLDSAGPTAFGVLFHMNHLLHDSVSFLGAPQAAAVCCALLVPDVLTDELVALHSELLKLFPRVRLFTESEEVALLRQAKSLRFTHIVHLRRNQVRIKTVLTGRQFDCPIGNVAAVLERSIEDGSEGGGNFHHHHSHHCTASATSAEIVSDADGHGAAEQEFHFLLSGAKHQRTLLREKAAKALAALKDCPVLIHEIPRDLLLAALDGKTAVMSGWKDAEERDLALKLPQTIKRLVSEAASSKKPLSLVFYNHRDSTVFKTESKLK